MDAVNDGAAITADVRRIGPALVFERFWEETGCRAVIEKLAGERKNGFALELAVFLTVLHRLFACGSDRASDRWREDYRIMSPQVLAGDCVETLGAVLCDDVQFATTAGIDRALWGERDVGRRNDEPTSIPVDPLTEPWSCGGR